MNRADLIASIVASPDKHQVNREEKMNATIDVMCKNLERRHKNNSGIAKPFDERKARGYGTGGKTGD